MEKKSGKPRAAAVTKQAGWNRPLPAVKTRAPGVSRLFIDGGCVEIDQGAKIKPGDMAVVIDKSKHGEPARLRLVHVDKVSADIYDDGSPSIGVVVKSTDEMVVTRLFDPVGKALFYWDIVPYGPVTAFGMQDAIRRKAKAA